MNEINLDLPLFDAAITATDLPAVASMTLQRQSRLDEEQSSCGGRRNVIRRCRGR